MKYIAQKDMMGCGIACVAMATELTYDEAKQYFDAKHAVKRGYHCKNIVSALSVITGKKYRFRKYRKGEDIEKYLTGTILFVEHPHRYEYGHYLVKTNGGWGDPWINIVEQNNLEVIAGLQYKLPGMPEWLIYEQCE